MNTYIIVVIKKKEVIGRITIYRHYTYMTAQFDQCYDSAATKLVQGLIDKHLFTIYDQIKPFDKGEIEFNNYTLRFWKN